MNIGPLIVTVKLDGKARALKGLTQGGLLLIDEMSPWQQDENAALIAGVKRNIRKLYQGLAVMQGDDTET